MRRKIFVFILLVLCLFSYVSFQQKVDTLQDLYKTTAMSQIAANFYNNGWIDFKRELKISPKDIFVKYKNLFGLGKEDEMKLIKVIHDKDDGSDHYRYQQYHREIKVEGMIYNIHSNYDVAYSANGQIAPFLDIDPTPKISLKEAKSLTFQNEIVSRLRGSFFRDSTLGKDSLLIIKDPNSSSIDNQKYILAYSFKFVDTLKHEVFKIQVDANVGNVLSVKSTSLNTLPKPDNPGTCTTWYNGNKVVNTYFHNANWPCPDYYYMGPGIVGPKAYLLEASITEFPCIQPSPGYLWSSQNIWTNPAVKTHVSAFWAIQKSNDFFTNLGTDGITNNWALWIIVDSPFTYPNADYNPDTHEFRFGAPVANKCNHMVELDIVGHEYGHGVIHYLCGDLSPAGETGSLQEGLCDAFGAMIESSQGFNETTVYTMGYSSILDNTYKRSLKYPKLLGAHTIDQNCQTALGQPNTYLGEFWDSRGCDLSGIHTNSTVISHWFYLLAEGGSGINDFNQTYNVVGIGRDMATRIIYKYIKKQYLGYGSSFTDARIGTIKAACDEFGLCSNAYYQVINAWNAVNVSSTYIGLDYVKIINPPTFVCYPSGSNVSINCNPCTTGTVTWHKSDNLSFVGGSTGNSVTVCPVSSQTGGSGWLSATLVTNCGTVEVPQVTFWVGTPVVTVTGDATSACTNTTHYFTATADSHANASNFTWNLVPLNGNYLSPYGYQNNSCAITFYNPSSASGYTVQSRAQNSCGTGGYGSTSIYIHNCYSFSLSPNPASETVTVTKKVSGATDGIASEAISEDATTIYTIRIIDFYGALHYSATKSGESFTFPVSNLKDGQYIVQITEGKNTTNVPLIVKH